MCVMWQCLLLKASWFLSHHLLFHPLPSFQSSFHLELTRSEHGIDKGSRTGWLISAGGPWDESPIKFCPDWVVPRDVFGMIRLRSGGMNLLLFIQLCTTPTSFSSSSKTITTSPLPLLQLPSQHPHPSPHSSTSSSSPPPSLKWFNLFLLEKSRLRELKLVFRCTNKYRSL